MNFRFTVVETSLNRAEFRWKWLRFLQHSFFLASMVLALLLALEGAIVFGWLTNKSLAIILVSLLGAVGLLAWLVMVIGVATGAPDRNWLAAAIERVDRRLLDRLNTLLFLEKRGAYAHTAEFALRIQRQTHDVLNEQPSPSPFHSRRPLLWFLVATLLLTASVVLFQVYSPWTRLVTVAKAPPPPPPEKPLELALPGTNNAETKPLWGEVRITDPGADLKVTKVDVVPLQIEAAANEPLKNVGWFSTINETAEVPHELPPPSEPRYAVYQPTLYLDELKLADWDVMTYYARAKSDKDNSFASEVYFLEVRPFREDILKMPGGEGGKPYQCLNELSALISRQQHVIRQTHQHVQNPPPEDALKKQDRKKLSDAESDLKDSTQHLYAKMASELENKPIGDALDNLAKAEKALEGASKQLQDNSMSEAQSGERAALSGLVAARKAFQKAVSEHPEAFEDEKPEEAPPVAQELNQIAEFRNEANAAQQFVQKTLEQQRSLEQQAKGASRNAYAKLAETERQLEQSLEKFQNEHPQVFKGSSEQARQAEQAMKQASEALEAKTRDAPATTKKATQDLARLSDSLLAQSAEQQLANAYKLKRLLDEQANSFKERSQGNTNVSDGDLQKTAREARQTVNELKKMAEQEPTRDAFGQPLREALSGQNKIDLDVKLNRLEQASQVTEANDQASKQQHAGEASEALGKVSQAFTQSQPKSLQMAHKTDQLKPGEQDSFSQGMTELDSLLKLLENHRAVSPQDQAKQCQQALLNLQTGLRSLYGDNERGNQLLLQLQQMLKAETPLDIGDLKKLMDELQHFSVETSEKLAKNEEPEINNIDPLRLPPAYRGRIQKYFQKLSEK